MKTKEIRDLLSFISEIGLEEVNIETEEFKLHIKRSNEVQNVSTVPISTPTVAPQIATAPKNESLEKSSTQENASKSASNDNLKIIKSPMIGTFYRSQNPESPSFVNVGDTVSKGQTVCIVEAMKLFNEIEADVSGKIVEVLVENAQPVEFDQPLFKVDPS